MQKIRENPSFYLQKLMLGLRGIRFNLLYPLSNSGFIQHVRNNWACLELQSTVLGISRFRASCEYLKMIQHVRFFKTGYKS